MRKINIELQGRKDACIMFQIKKKKYIQKELCTIPRCFKYKIFCNAKEKEETSKIKEDLGWNYLRSLHMLKPI
jgi:hypothetical protein